MTITLDAPRTVHGNIVRDSVIVMGRELRPMLRDPVSVIFSLVQPLILLALFGPAQRGPGYR
jgi:ABC-2 type transport system permease protein